MHHGDMMKRVIAKTNDPFMAMRVQDAYTKNEALGKAMADHVVNKASVQAITDRLLKDFPDAELDKLCEQPEFVVALCGMLNQSILAYVRRLIHD